jgi:quinol monooxygenase YgiN
MSDRISLVLEFSVIAGKQAEAEADMAAILECIGEENTEIDYAFYRDPAQPGKIHALESHPNAESMLKHMERAGPLLAKSRSTANLDSIKVLGNVSPVLAGALAGMGVTAIPFWRGR